VEKFCTAGQAIDNNMAMSIACWITKATNTYSGYVILIALALQQSLHKYAYMSDYTHTACLVVFWEGWWSSTVIAVLFDSTTACSLKN
jgi:hypothetical protein